MQRPSPTALSALFLAVLLPLFYPALFLDRRLAPEAALHSVAPWRSLLGPYPQASPLIGEAAAALGPRLATIARDPLASALWNPWIGGGRGGWLASANEGGTPLTLAAACLARPEWNWTALLALTVSLALAGTYWVVRLLGLPPPAAAVGAAAYALSGAASSTWLTTDGAALAIGPFLLVPLLHPAWRATTRAAAATTVLGLLLYCGVQAAQFVALAAAGWGTKTVGAPPPRRRWALPLLAVALALATALPRLWLAAATREPGAPLPAPTAMPAPGVAAMVVPFPHGDPIGSTLAPSPPGAAALRAAQAAFVGGAVVLLAVVGATRPFPAGRRAFWVTITLSAALLTYLPDGPVGVRGPFHRPFGALALGFGVLAAAGSHRLMQRLGPPPARAWLGAALVAVVLLRLLPVAAHGLPFAPRAAAIEAPVDPERAGGGEARLVAFGATLPPDTGAAFSLADVRAASLAAEPRYAALLRPRKDGTVGFDRVLDPVLARLGARLLMEPAELHVVSAELFSRTAAMPGQRLPPHEAGEAAIAATLPEGAVRVALPAGTTPPERVSLMLAGGRHDLTPDHALALESDAWIWFEVPAKLRAGEATLLVQPAAAVADEPTLLWDTSGVRLLGEKAGARTWLATQARPLAFAASGVYAEGDAAPAELLAVQVPRDRVPALAATGRPAAVRVHVTHVSATRVRVQAQSFAPRLLVIMLKYRPALWRARVNGRPTATEAVDGVWTGLVIPPGTSYVELRASLPGWVVLAAAAGVIGTISLAAGSRRLSQFTAQRKVTP